MITQNPDNSATATDVSDFDGYDILYKEYWKPGVRRVYARKILGNGQATLMIVFVDEKLARKLKECEE